MENNNNNKILAIIIILVCVLVFLNIKSNSVKNTAYETGPKREPILISKPDLVKVAKEDRQTVANLNTLAVSLLQEAEKPNGKEDKKLLIKYIKQMAQLGVSGFPEKPQIAQKRTPHCPPVSLEINGQKIWGDKCLYLVYMYKGKKYKVGYCKNAFVEKPLNNQ